MSKERPTHAEIAEALGLTRARVSQLAGQGMPVDSVEAAQAWRVSRLNVAARKPAPATFPPLAPEPVNDSDEEDFQQARTRREIAEANLAEMREREIAGQLIRVEAIRAAWARRISATRDALLQLPHRLAPVLAAETDMERVSHLLDAELRQCLHDLSRSATAGLPTDGGNQ